MSPGELAFLSVAEQARRVRDGSLDPRELVAAYVDRIAAADPSLGCYLHVAAERARAGAAAVLGAKAHDHDPGPLAGVPIAVKDIIVTRGMPTTAGSKMLDGWIPPYDATVVRKLWLAGAVVLGKTNLDEFAMGSSTEHSAFRPCRNPWDRERVPGGSSGGSAAAVAAGLCGAALGTDTGGSIRQPAAMCGIVGIKPTYGRVSRWGVIAFASSLDQVGPMARSVEDAALLLEAISGHDPLDSTSIDAPPLRLGAALGAGVRGLRVGVPRAWLEHPGLDPEVGAAVDAAAATLAGLGAELVPIELPHSRLALPTYYLIAPAEASSNLARYDGVRYGLRAGGQDNLLDLYRRSRAAGFGAEVKRRIMLGTYALRAGYYDAYYKKAQQLRALIKRDFDDAFARVDLVLGPTAPTAAFRLGEKTDDPMAMYLADVFTLGCNLAGLPGASVPCGFTGGGLPIGLQLIGRPLGEETLVAAAAAYERAAGWAGRRPPEVSA